MICAKGNQLSALSQSNHSTGRWADQVRPTLSGARHDKDSCWAILIELQVRSLVGFGCRTVKAR